MSINEPTIGAPVECRLDSPASGCLASGKRLLAAATQQAAAVDHCGTYGRESPSHGEPVYLLCHLRRPDGLMRMSSLRWLGNVFVRNAGEQWLALNSLSTD